MGNCFRFYKHWCSLNDKGVMAWAKEQARIETEKYKEEQSQKIVTIPFRADRQLEYESLFNMIKSNAPDISAVKFELQ